jgi:hypothetical protein
MLGVRRAWRLVNMLLKTVQSSGLEIADTAYLTITPLSFLFVELDWKHLDQGRGQLACSYEHSSEI